MQAIAGLWLRRSAAPHSGTDAAQLSSAMLQRLSSTVQAYSTANPAPGLALGARSLRVTALLAHGASPQIATSSGSRGCVLVADVRLDNREELAHLLALGPAAEELSDSELLLHAWQAWGRDCVSHLRGGFAFACWSGADRQLFLARDHSGEKPLFFTQKGSCFAFASMPKALLAVPGVSGALDTSRVADFLVMPGQGSGTLFKEMERVLPGHFLAISDDRVETRQYWRPRLAQPIRYRRDAEYVEDFRERFTRAVGDRLRSTAPIGAQISGGLDSTSVTATAARLLGQCGEGLTAYTAIPSDALGGATLTGRFANEGPAAAEVTALYPNIGHRFVREDPDRLIEALERGCEAMDQPVFNPVNQLWLDEIFTDASRSGIGVVLQGAGGNLTISLAGMIALADMLRSGRWLSLLWTVHALRARGYASWRGGLSWAFGTSMPGWGRRLLNRDPSLFAFDFSPVNLMFAREVRLRERALDHFFSGDNDSETALNRLYQSYDPGVFNMYAAARWGVESRDPTLDKRVYEFCHSIPIEQYLVGGQTRSLIRRAMQGTLPEATLARTTRGLQGADWFLVLGSQLGRISEQLGRIEQSPLARRILDLPRLRRLAETWPTSGFDRLEIHDSYHSALSRGLAAGIFLLKHDPEYPD